MITQQERTLNEELNGGYQFVYPVSASPIFPVYNRKNQGVFACKSFTAFPGDNNE